MAIFHKKWKKYNEIQLTKNKMYLNIRKMTNHPPSPDYRVFCRQQVQDDVGQCFSPHPETKASRNHKK